MLYIDFFPKYVYNFCIQFQISFEFNQHNHDNHFHCNGNEIFKGFM